MGEDAHRLAQGRSTDTKLRHQLRLGRELRAWLELAERELLLQLLDHVVDELFARHGAEGHARSTYTIIC